MSTKFKKVFKEHIRHDISDAERKLKEKHTILRYRTCGNKIRGNIYEFNLVLFVECKFKRVKNNVSDLDHEKFVKLVHGIFKSYNYKTLKFRFLNKTIDSVETMRNGQGALAFGWEYSFEIIINHKYNNFDPNLLRLQTPTNSDKEMVCYDGLYICPVEDGIEKFKEIISERYDISKKQTQNAIIEKLVLNGNRKKKRKLAFIQERNENIAGEIKPQPPNRTIDNVQLRLTFEGIRINDINIKDTTKIRKMANWLSYCADWLENK